MLQVDKDSFQAEVLDAEGLVLVDFFGDGCVPCEALLPDIVALAEEYGNEIKFVKLNTSGARRLAIAQKVLGLPTVTLYKVGQKLSELTKDEAVKANIEAMIKTALGK
jgi:thioredoxin 1